MNRWDEKYRSGNFNDAGAATLLRDAVSCSPPGRALDLACGAGRNSLFLARNGWTVTAVDSSVEALKILSRRSSEEKLSINIVCADLEKNEFTTDAEAFELVADFFFLQRNLWPLVQRAVSPSGIFVAEIFVRDNSPEMESLNPDYMLEAGELRSAFDNWIIEEYCEGRQSGHSRSTTQLIARKPQLPGTG